MVPIFYSSHRTIVFLSMVNKVDIITFKHGDKVDILTIKHGNMVDIMHGDKVDMLTIKINENKLVLSWAKLSSSWD